MRELDGLSYAELADALGDLVPAIKSLLVRARIGLVEAGEARDAACADIRADLARAHDRGGARPAGRAGTCATATAAASTAMRCAARARAWRPSSPRPR